MDAWDVAPLWTARLTAMIDRRVYDSKNAAALALDFDTCAAGEILKLHNHGHDGAFTAMSALPTWYEFGLEFYGYVASGQPRAALYHLVWFCKGLTKAALESARKAAQNATRGIA